MLRLVSTLALLIVASAASAQTGDWQTPVVDGVGPAVHFPDTAVQPDSSLTYRVVFDATRLGDDGGVPLALSQAARFLNSFALHGAEPDALDLVVVFHGAATRAALSDAAYAEHIGGDNPSTELLARLRALGVRAYVCGNSLVGGGYAPNEVGPDVELATSAMAVVTTFMLRGYAILDY